MHHTGEGADDDTFLACGAPFQMQLEATPYQFDYEHKWFAEHNTASITSAGSCPTPLTPSNTSRRTVERDRWRAPAPLGDQAVGLEGSSVEVDDAPAALARVVELGGTAMGDPVQLDDTGAAAVYCRDPFGTIIELMSVGSSLASLDDV